MSFVKALANRILQKNTRKLEEQDIWRLYHLVHFHKALVAKGDQIESAVERLYLPLQSASLDDQYKTVHTHIQAEVITRLRKVKGENEATPLGQIILQTASREEPQSITGVLLKSGFALPGAFVCFFPGKVYMLSQIKEMPNYPNITANNPFLMARTDDSIIDAQEYSSHHKGNPLAVGHLVRHPPEGTPPNVMPFSFDVVGDFPRELLPFVPNKYHRKPGFLFSDKRVVLRTIVFVATRQIVQGEELFLNYRLHPDSIVPEWYSSIEESEDKKRWSS